MSKDTNALVAARAALTNAEKGLGNPHGFPELRDAVTTLVEVISGTAPGIEKDIARKLLLSCRRKAVEEVRAILANIDGCETATLDHWRGVMELLADAGLGDDPEFEACRARLHAKRSIPTIPNFTSAELAVLEKELQAALDCLSMHRRQLAKIKSGVGK